MVVVLLTALIVVFNTIAASSSFDVPILPGYPGPLPFKLQTGYVGVGDEDERQLFYYFIESESDPVRDPLLFWFIGGPGCSGFSALVYEIGPLKFDHEEFDDGLPSFVLNPYSWTKFANILFIDALAGSGFSYAKSENGYASSDTIAAEHNYMFLRKWLLSHPWFIRNRFYLGGDSYGGKTVALLASEIIKGNEAGLEPQIRFQGYMIGNPVVDEDKDHNEQTPYAHRMGLISDEYFEMAKTSCDGEYVNPDPNNKECKYALQLVKDCIQNIYTAHILEPSCGEHPGIRRFDNDPIINSEEHRPINVLKQERQFCREDLHELSTLWANDLTVQEALHVRKGTIDDWVRCNDSIRYEKNIQSTCKLHGLLSKDLHILVYSGDHDLGIPHIATLKWVRLLNISVDEQWRPWMVNGQVGGYTEKYGNNGASLIFATVKGGGHTAPEYMPKECFAMADRWLSSYLL
ncbi:serine carboxypeptidase-like 17 isoform X4 [Andrographis paniculata]|uniref:serine carboxypeptidase-like 17 isoform X4 n=1 Tax=Andrographis paniculata TaxID=175694 RepID=UPI0021E8A029|nr:serine carboxypeptidase-like 17 isoform X4 [Andrographis paniculata]